MLVVPSLFPMRSTHAHYTRFNVHIAREPYYSHTDTTITVLPKEPILLSIMPDGPLKTEWIPDSINKTPHHKVELAVDRINKDNKLSEPDKLALADAFEELCRDVAQDDHFGGWSLNNTMRYSLMTFREVSGLTWLLRGGEPAEATIERIKNHVKDRDVAARAAEEHYKSVRTVCGTLSRGDRSNLPDVFELLPTNITGESDPTPKKTNIIHYEEMGKMAKAGKNARDRALIPVQWGAGARPMSEMYQLQFDDVEDRGTHIVLSFPEGSKTGKRDIRLYIGAPQLRKWMEVHPAQGKPDGPDPNDYVWSSLYKNNHMNYNGFARRFRFAGERVGLEKTHTPQHMRRCRASILAKSTTVSQPHLETHFGWRRGSEIARSYIAKFGNATEAVIARHDGVDIDEEENQGPIAPVKCNSCSRWTPRYLDECMWCSADVDAEQPNPAIDVHQPDSGEDDLLTRVLDGEIDSRDLEGLRRLEPVVRSRPEIFEQIDQLIEMLRRFEDDATNN